MELAVATSRSTGKERDAETGLDDFVARYYASAIGRFTIPDWSGQASTVPYAQFEDPQSLNLYTYVRNNPITRYDADGHAFEDAFRGLFNASLAVGLRKLKRKKTDNPAQTLAAQVPSQTKVAIQNAIRASNAPTKDDKKGGYHEESVKSGTDASGNVVVSPSIPGPYAVPGTNPHTMFAPADPKLDERLVTVDVFAHIHPRGGDDRSFVQGPSQGDFDSAKDVPAIHLVVGAADKKVYFYNGSGQVGKPIKLKEFLGDE